MSSLVDWMPMDTARIANQVALGLLALGCVRSVTNTVVGADPALTRGAVVTLTPREHVIGIGGSRSFIARVVDSHGQSISAPISYSSLDPTVAYLDARGDVRGVRGGIARIVASVPGGVPDTARLRVLNINDSAFVAVESRFAPDSIEVPACGIVTFITAGSERHAIRLGSGETMQSFTLAPLGRRSTTLCFPGTHVFACNSHDHGRGVVVVRSR